MSRYVIKLDALSTIVAEDIDLASDFCDIVFAHKLNGKDRIEMKGLSFGFTLVKDGDVVHQFSYPPEGTKLLRSDQQYICAERVQWTPNAHYSIAFWFKELNADPIMLARDFLSPKGIAPEKNWQWNDIKKTYEEPSIPYPDIHFELRKPMLSSLIWRNG
jgi:hypothetical protein